jgi:hypothetical protein
MSQQFVHTECHAHWGLRVEEAGHMTTKYGRMDVKFEGLSYRAWLADGGWNGRVGFVLQYVAVPARRLILTSNFKEPF